MTRRVLVIGGTGGFGRRLVEGLIATTNLDVVIGGRRLDRSQTLASSQPAGRATAVALDTTTIDAVMLKQTGASVVVDAAGPYQGADYRVPRAAIAAGLHYLDLADARDFVAGFPALDAAARQAGVIVLTGASSTPALSHAALDRLTAGWRRIDRIEIAISPGNRAAPRGLAVIRSILSYAGRPVRVFVNGEWAVRPGWGMLTRRDMWGLGRRFLSLCETPDLDLVPERFSPREAAVFRAGVELVIMHLGLWLLSLPVRAGIVRSLMPLAPLLQRGMVVTRDWGTDCGGMFVEAIGLGPDGDKVRALWSLVARGGDGPFIPTLPALAAIRAIAAGASIAPGARPCVGILDLATIAREFAPYRIETEMTQTRC